MPRGTQVTVETFEVVAGKPIDVDEGFYVEIN